MISECYVYITLPGQVEPVTAGKFVLTERGGIAIGRFVYGKSYLARSDALPLDPIELKLATQTYETAALKGIFGALRDASPDYWGRRVIERHVGKHQLSELDFLIHSPDDRAGALGFGLNQDPPAPKRIFNQTLDLKKLQEIAYALLNDDVLPADPALGQIEELMLIGTSMGGARPKAIVENDEGLWIAKFNRPDDKWNMARVEHAMLVLARACGLDTSESRIIEIAGRDILLVKRFDREKTAQGYLRARMISALTLLRAEDSHRSRDKWSYILLAEEIRRISANPAEDAAELFRRMCFNALISNIDDHPRNHAVIAKDKKWRLSPAYDLTPSMPVSPEHRDLALICGAKGRYANADNLLSESARFLLEKDVANKIILKLEEQVKKTWYSTARSVGVTEHDCEMIQSAFVYPGFRQQKADD